MLSSMSSFWLSLVHSQIYQEALGVERVLHHDTAASATRHKLPQLPTCPSSCALQTMGLRPQFFLKAADVTCPHGAAGGSSGAELAPPPRDVLEALEVFVLAPGELASRLDALLRPRSAAHQHAGAWDGVAIRPRGYTIWVAFSSPVKSNSHPILSEGCPVSLCTAPGGFNRQVGRCASRALKHGAAGALY